MNIQTHVDATDVANWRSLDFACCDGGYRISECAGRFRREIQAEFVLRYAEALCTLAGYFQWFMPLQIAGMPGIWAKAVLSIAFAGTGLALIMFARRGFRRELFVDQTAHQLQLAKLNAQGEGRMLRHIPMRTVETLHVRCPDGREGTGALVIGFAGVSKPICVLRGRPSEIEALQRRLCRDIKGPTGDRHSRWVPA